MTNKELAEKIASEARMMCDDAGFHTDLVRAIQRILDEHLAAEKPAEPCVINPYWSGVCSRGTKCCNEKHTESEAMAIVRRVDEWSRAHESDKIEVCSVERLEATREDLKVVECAARALVARHKEGK